MIKKEDNKASARERLLDAASLLFYRDGINGTGIDAIVKEAGVAKKSLYNNFTSKAELVEAYITERHKEWLGLYAHRNRLKHRPVESILAVFDAYVDHAVLAYEHGFRGCGLLNAAAELSSGDVGRKAVRRHKEEVEQIIKVHLDKLEGFKAGETQRLARHISFLLEGSIMRAGLEGDSKCLIEARAIVSSILNEAI